MALSLFAGSNVDVIMFVKEESKRTQGDVFKSIKLSNDGKGKLGPAQRDYLKQ